jgi:hypothetical protein
VQPSTEPVRRPVAEASGPVLFARYAFGPNRLGYCGPDAIEELFGEGTTAGDDRALRELATSFDGAWPYLTLIAEANGRRDPLDREVVEAYWLGNDLLDRVAPGKFGASLEGRFRARLRPAGWRWLAGAPQSGGVPVHAFHVLDVFPRVGLLRTGVVDQAIETMDSCRIRWGRVLERDGDWLVVNVVPLVMTAGRLELGPPRPERIEAWRGGSSFVADVKPEDVISIHWSWACDRLAPDQLAGLITWTNRQLGVANLTI